MAKKLGGKRLSGNNPLAYIGVEPSSPSNFIIVTRAPTINDTEHNIGTVWLHDKNDSSVVNDLYALVALDNSLNSTTTPQGPAQWIMIGAGTGELITLTGNSGGAITPDSAGNINVVGDASTITFAGVLGTNTLTANVTGGTNGQLLIAATAGDPAWASLTSTGSTIIFTPGANSLNLEASASGMGAVLGLTPDSGTSPVVPDGSGNITITGGSTGYTFVGGTNIVTLTGGPSSLTITALNDGDSAYTVLSTDVYMTCDVSSGVLEIDFPNAPDTGRVYYVKDATGSAATNNITLTTVGGVVTIDGGTSFVMNSDFQSTSLIFTGSAYEIF
jgi:hypothetical protein